MLGVEPPHRFSIAIPRIVEQLPLERRLNSQKGHERGDLGALMSVGWRLPWKKM
jgi:hypothetical protein